MRHAWLPALVLMLCCATTAEARRPNVLFLLADDQRPDTIHALGNDLIQTPHLDRLVRTGTAFTRAYCMGSTQPAVCVPSRAMLMSGRTLFRAPVDLAAVPLMPEVFGAAGYDTFGTGKWHNRPASYARAFRQGADIFFGGMADQFHTPIYPFDPSGQYPAASKHPAEHFSSETFADAAIGFLQSRKGSDRPFFCYVAFTSPHDPRTPPGSYATMYDPAKMPLPANYLPEHPFDNGELKVRDEQLAPWPRTPAIVRKELADYYGMISHHDAQIGRILQALDATGEAANTIVVFTSDHGLAIGSHGLMGKQNLYEHSMGTPLVIAGPDVPQGRRSDAFCYLFDLFPTLCELTGVAVPSTVEGVSLAPILEGEPFAPRDSVFGAYMLVQRSVRDRQWKLIRYPRVDRTQLFNLADDPDERRDLSAEPGYAERMAAMVEKLRGWQRTLGDELSLEKATP